VIARRSVYLAGPIIGCSWEEASGWRTTAAALLQSHGIGSYSPLRGHSFLADETEIQPFSHAVFISDEEMVHRDLGDIFQSDAVIVNLLAAKRISLGTMVEIGWAYSFGRLIVAIMEEEGNLHDHPFTRVLFRHRVDTLEAAVSTVVRVLAGVHVADRQ